MKRFLAIAVLLAISLSFVSCGNVEMTRSSESVWNTAGNTESPIMDSLCYPPKDSSAFLGMDHSQVESLFQKAGFERITSSPIDDIDSTSDIPDGAVDHVTINGIDEYTIKTGFAEDDEVVIFYHNIPRIIVSVSSDDAVGNHYMEVAKMLFDSGFSNIETEELYDLPADSDSQTVLSINGETAVTGSEVPFDSKIDVTEHFPISVFPTTISIDFASNLFLNKYDVVVSLDGSELGTLSHGEDAIYSVSLPEGTYKIDFTSAKDQNVSGSVDLVINSDTEVTYRISCETKQVNVKESSFKHALTEADVMLPFSQSHYLRKDCQSVVNELKALGFGQVTAKATTDSFWTPDEVNNVVKVEINNESQFEHGRIIAKTAPVTVYYHIPDFKFDSSFLTVTEKDTFGLPFTMISGDAVDTIEFRIDDPDVLQRNDDGTFTALVPGKAMVTACSGGHTYSRIRINVEKISVPIEKLDFSSSEIDISVGSTFKIDYTVVPADANRFDMTVTGSNDNIEIMKNGTSYSFYADKEGDTDISFYQDDRLLGTCIVHASIVDIEALTIEETPEELFIGQSIKMRFILSPGNATNKGITVDSSDNDVAETSFDERGDSVVQIKAKSAGSAVITVTTPDGTEYTHSLTIKEIDPVSITLLNAKPDQRIEVGTPVDLKVLWQPYNTSDKELTWSSSNTKVINVDADGILDIVGIGEAEITATHKSGLASSILLVVEPTLVTGININVDRAVPNKIYAGDSFSIDASVYPENATDKTITFSSKDESVAKVSDKGVVTAVGPGSTDIIVSTPNGLQKSVPITVSQSPQKFRISYSAYVYSNDHVGNDWSTWFEVNGERFYSGSTLILDPDSSFTVRFTAEEKEQYPDTGWYYETIYYSDDLCRNGYSISTDVEVREDRGQYAGNVAIWKLSITITPVR